MQERLHRIVEAWYIFENAFFEVCLSHELRQNATMTCAMRCGKGVIEYNASMLSPLSDDLVELMLKRECIRIILKHPYDRQPLDCPPLARYGASEVVIGDHYPMRSIGVPLSMDFGLPRGKSFEWYAHRMKGMIVKESPDVDPSVPVIMTDEEAAAATALWDEDDFQKSNIENAFERVRRAKSWGSMPGSLMAHIEAGVRGQIDYRNILGGFRASILSSRRSLTRMRPNRRTGFASMGSTQRFATRILVAIDISASVSDESLSLFLSVVNKAFRYGVERLDLVTFDVNLHDFYELRRAVPKITVHGRGGTSYQKVVDLAQEKEYDGLLIFTDGEAEVPKMPAHPCFRIAWAFENREAYENHRESLSAVGRCFPIIE